MLSLLTASLVKQKQTQPSRNDDASIEKSLSLSQNTPLVQIAAHPPLGANAPYPTYPTCLHLPTYLPGRRARTRKSPRGAQSPKAAVKNTHCALGAREKYIYTHIHACIREGEMQSAGQNQRSVSREKGVSSARGKKEVYASVLRCVASRRRAEIRGRGRLALNWVALLTRRENGSDARLMHASCAL